MEAVQEDLVTLCSVRRVDGPQVCAKFLFSNAAAGAIIGREGQNRTELQLMSGAKIQLSRNNHFYPGTTDRILLLSGTLKSLLTALYHIQANLVLVEHPYIANIASVSTQLKLLMPAAACGSVIGKGGITIKSFSLDSGTSILISPQEKSKIEEYNRIVTITGEVDQVLRAVALIITKVADNPSYKNNITHSVTCGSSYLQKSTVASSTQPTDCMSKSITRDTDNGLSEGAISELAMIIADRHIELMIGKGGQTIIGLKKLLNVDILVSARGDLEVGMGNRMICLRGTSNSLRLAEMIIAQKVYQECLEANPFS